ncbi:MAG: Helix-turn-helix domain, partial [Thermoleophilia bacterium]|nr:Helix-turn-helix domain [Thermoleophilia bacterium]
MRDQEQIGAKIRELRETARMDQSQLGAALHLTQPDVSKIERGQRQVGGSELFLIARALGVRVDDILVPHGPD